MSNISELQSYIERLIGAASDDGTFLIVTVSGTEDFLQMIADSKGVQLDLPLITGRQMSLESSFRSIAEMEDCTVIENRGDDGARFLDVDLPLSIAEVTGVLDVFLRELFGVNESTRLEFEGECLEASH